MKRRCALLAVAIVVGACVAAPPACSSSSPVSVRVDRVSIVTKLGRKFAFRTVVTNRGSSPVTNLVAHLNVVSLRSGVYVDPEDWSTSRTRYVRAIRPHSSVTTTWRAQAVNAGSFGIYVAVLPANGTPMPPLTGPTVHVTVADRRTLSSNGILPLAVGIPALLGFLALAVWRRRRA
jgi:hypothetical protein